MNHTWQANLLSLLLNSLFSSVRNSLTFGNSKSLLSKSSIIFFFHIFADSLCTYNKIYYTCSSTDTSIIFILISSLYTITKPTALLISPSKVGSLVILPLNSVLCLGATLTPPISSFSYSATNATICSYITTICLSLCLNWSLKYSIGSCCNKKVNWWM